MKRPAFLCFLFLFAGAYTARTQDESTRNEPFFYKARLAFPKVPAGLPEAVAWTHSHMEFKTPGNTAESCVGLPFGWGFFGLVDDGKGWFRNNLQTVADLSRFSTDSIKYSPRIQVMAYAGAVDSLLRTTGLKKIEITDCLPALLALSELHTEKENSAIDYSINSFLYAVLNFLNDSQFQQKFAFPDYHLDLKAIFGDQNYRVLSSPKNQLSAHGIKSEEGIEYSSGTKTSCPDYPVSWCSWVASPNFGSRSGTAISSIVIHTVQGSYSSCINWFMNPSAQASTSYVIRSSDGQITQMVLEADKAWHVGSQNPYTIGYEHEGFVEQNTWYSAAMYKSSAELTRDIAGRYGINAKTMFFTDTLDNGTAMDNDLHVIAGLDYCCKISGHQHLPNQTHTDPGPYWSWDSYYKMVNDTFQVISGTDHQGTIVYPAGQGTNYGNLDRKVWVIQSVAPNTVQLLFNRFDLESDHDYLYAYDGPGIWSPKIGRYSNHSPGTIASTGSSLTLEFRSDCTGTASGWEAQWTVGVPITELPVFNTWPNPFTHEINIDFHSPVMAQIRLYNSTGRLLKEQFSEKKQHMVISNLQSLEEGIYFIHIIYPNGLQQTGKLIKL